MLVASPQTMFGPALVYDTVDDTGRPVRMLSVNGASESAMYLDGAWSDLVFEYTRDFDRAIRPGHPASHVLVIGCGAYSYPKHLIRTFPSMSVDAVEIDPAMEGIAREFFELDRLESEYAAESSGRLNLACADGRAFLEERAAQVLSDCDGESKAPAPLYDLIVNDSFAGKVPVAKLADVEAAHLAHALLGPQGVYVTNVVSSRLGPDARILRAQVTALFDAFAHVWTFQVGTNPANATDNYLVFASDSGPSPVGAQVATAFPRTRCRL